MSNRIASRETTGASSTGAEAKKCRAAFSCRDAERSIKLDVLGDHALGGKAFGVLESFGAPASAFFRIRETQEISREARFVLVGMKERGVAGDFCHRLAIRANDRATTGLRLGDGPAEPLAGGREKKCGGEIVKSFE